MDRFVDIIPKDCPNYSGRPLLELRGIIIHSTANFKGGADAYAHRKYFGRGVRRGAKFRKAVTHFVVDDRKVVQCLPLDMVGFHVGDKVRPRSEVTGRLAVIPEGGNPNNFTIGIEICVNADGDLTRAKENAAKLVRSLLKRFSLSIENVWRHYDITGKKCPAMFIKEEYWLEFKDWIVHGGPLESMEALRILADESLKRYNDMNDKAKKLEKENKEQKARIETLMTKTKKKPVGLFRFIWNTFFA